MRDKVICFIDDTDSCFSGWAKEVVKNISDQTYNTVSGNYPIYFNNVPATDKQVILVHTGVDIMYIGALQEITGDEDVIVLKDNLVKGIFYVDGSNEEEFVKAMGWQYEKFMSGTAVLFYATNNEPLESLPLNIIQQLVTPAAGINWLSYLIKYGYDDTTVVRFIDCNFLALSCMKEIIEWNGEDYPTFIRQMGERLFGFLGMPWNEGIKNIHNLDLDWATFLEEHPNWPDDWRKIRETVAFEFRFVNLYDTTTKIENWVDDRPNTFINLSNVFSYFTAGPLCSASSRLVAESYVIRQLKELRPAAIVSFLGRISDIFESNNNIMFGSAKDLNVVQPQKLNVPWHNNV